MRRFEPMHIAYRHLCGTCRKLLFPGTYVIYDWGTHKVYCRRCGAPSEAEHADKGTPTQS